MTEKRKPTRAELRAKMDKATTPKERRAVWCEALRSGRYRQTDGRLKKGGRFCCLGVASDLVDPKGVLWVEYQGGLSGEIRDLLGLAHSRGSYDNEESDHTYLIIENDEGTPFSKIADIIESEPEGLLAEEAS